MLNALKTLPKNLANRHVAIVVQDAAVNVWAANMNVLYVARSEGLKVLNVVAQKAEELKASQIN